MFRINGVKIKALGKTENCLELSVVEKHWLNSGPEIGDSRKTKCFTREKSSRVYRLLPLISTELRHLRKGF